ncbi:MAG TPA: PA2779 family protein [Terracidiphilus sp.]|nr:PA2779 family protein [Terracidiphilus sp.]
MLSERLKVVRALTASTLVAFAAPYSVVAQTADHLVSTTDLQRAAVDASAQRQQNLDTLKAFFGSDSARRALESARMDPQKVQNAVASLSDEELAQLAPRVSKAQSDFAAGSLSDRDLIILLLAIAALILIIVAVR